MKIQFYFISIFLLLSCYGYSQSLIQFKNYAIENTGLTVNFPYEPKKWKASYSEDSTVIYTNSLIFEEKIFSVFALSLIKKLHLNEVEGILEYYIETLKQDYKITQTLGNTTGIKLKQHPAAIGVEEFWQDRFKRKYWVKGWADTKYMGILLIISPNELPSKEFESLFLNAFYFPGDKFN